MMRHYRLAMRVLPCLLCLHFARRSMTSFRSDYSLRPYYTSERSLVFDLVVL